MHLPSRFTATRLAVVASLAIACAPAGNGAAGSHPLLYVANAHDGTISTINSATGSATRQPAPAAPQAWQIAAGRDGRRFLTLGGGSTDGGDVFVSGRDDAAWWRRQIAVEPDAAGTLLSGDGQQHGLLAYGPGTRLNRSPTFACRLALIDMESGAVTRRATACADGETVTALSLVPARGSDGASSTGATFPSVGRTPSFAFAGIWSHRTGGRVVSLDLATGVALLAAAVPGVPGALLVGADHVHVLVTDPPAEPWQRWQAMDGAPDSPPSIATLWRTSFAVEGLTRLAVPIRSPALVPNSSGGGSIVALGEAGRTLVRLDVATGAARRLGTLPVAGSAIAVHGERAFIAMRERDSVAVYDLTRSHFLRPVATGRGPLALALTHP